MEPDLGDPRILLRDDVLDDPRMFHDVLRSKAPVWQIPGQDTVLVSDPVLIREAVRRPADFSSNLVSILHDDGTGCPATFAMARFGDPVHVLSTADQPLHARHRKLLQSHLSPATVAGLEPAITRIVTEHLDAVIEAGEVDFVATFGDLVPARTVCELIGLPPQDAPWLVSTVSVLGALLDGVTSTCRPGRILRRAPRPLNRPGIPPVISQWEAASACPSTAPCVSPRRTLSLRCQVRALCASWRGRRVGQDTDGRAHRLALQRRRSGCSRTLAAPSSCRAWTASSACFWH